MASAKYRRAAAILRARRAGHPIEREYAVVGQTRGTVYDVWHVEPTPTDPFARNELLEQLGLDAAEAFGGISTVYATDPADAAARTRREQARLAGLADTN